MTKSMSITEFFTSLRSSKNAEHEQGYIRVAFGFILAGFVWVSYIGAEDKSNWIPVQQIIVLFVPFELFALGVLYWIAKTPTVVESRRLIVITVDILALSTTIIIAGNKYGGALLFAYFWIIVGYAYRFGIKYMIYSVLFSTLIYSTIMFSGYFLDPQKISSTPVISGILVGIIAVSFYLSKFIKRNSDSLHEAQTANRHKSLFLANMNHELRTPLNSIIALSDLINQEKDINKISEYATKIEKSGDQLLKIINDIIDYTQLESSGQNSKPTVLSLPEIVSFVVDLLTSQKKDKDINIDTLYVSGTPEYVYGDEVKIRKLLINLLANAIKFTDKGHVQIKISKARSDIGDTSNSLLRFDVTDTGMGIAEDQVDKIFNEFVQADGSNTRRYGGTGLGLAICKKIVTSLRGEIGVETTPGQGSNFWFELPFENAKKEEYVAAVLKDSENTSGTSTLPEQLAILIAEDNPDNQYVYKQILSSVGCDIDIANDGKEAIEKLSTKSYDIAIIDHQMPFFSGYEVMKKYKNEIGGQTKLILLTADVSVETKEKYGSLTDAIESKPIRSDRLLTIVNEQVLSIHAGRNETTAVDKKHATQCLPVDVEEMLDMEMIKTNNKYADISEHFNLFTLAFNQQYKLLESSISPYEKEYIEKMLHGLKSSSGQVGAKLLCDLIGEYMAKIPSDSDSLRDMLEAIDNVYLATCHEFQALLKNGNLTLVTDSNYSATKNN